MKQLAILASVLCAPLLVSASQSDVTSDPFNRITLEKMGAFDGVPVADVPITDLPEYPLRCEFEHRSVCAGGEMCKSVENAPGAYIVISKADMTYRRCDRKGCGTHKIDAIGAPQQMRNISMGSIGTIVKLGPGNRFIDIATQGALTFISDGKCRREI